MQLVFPKNYVYPDPPAEPIFDDGEKNQLKTYIKAWLNAQGVPVLLNVVLRESRDYCYNEFGKIVPKWKLRKIIENIQENWYPDGLPVRGE